MIELILHPGHSKCGSTTIQDFLYANRLVLRERGIFFPDSEFNFPGNKEYQIDRTHTPRDFIEKVIQGELSIDVLEKKLDTFLIKAEEQGCKKLIITAENLVNAITSPQLKSIHSLFSTRFSKTKIIYYIRDQKELLLSAWQQWGHKKGETLEVYIDKMLKTNFGNYTFVTHQLSAYYPNAELKVCSLDKKHLIKSSLTSDFCVRAGLNSKGLNFSREVSNAGLSSAVCESLTKIHTVYENPHTQKVKNAILASAPNSKKLISKKYSAKLPLDLESKISGRYLESNKQLEKLYYSGNPVFPSTDRKNDSNSENEMSVLQQRIEKLEDIVAIQMDMILTLSGKK